MQILMFKHVSFPVTVMANKNRFKKINSRAYYLENYFLPTAWNFSHQEIGNKDFF